MARVTPGSPHIGRWLRMIVMNCDCCGEEIGSCQEVNNSYDIPHFNFWAYVNEHGEKGKVTSFGRVEKVTLCKPCATHCFNVVKNCISHKI
jgi:hypothetical protein